ncbi:hypothetical protein N7G274_003680 [Stereocaulon virgatum]|uniref:Uncharacterized protein n=1 Tax=Stereocaulon virgatum TaxID=373712 RepID=A0ABR4AD08_9LECA
MHDPKIGVRDTSRPDLNYVPYQIFHLSELQPFASAFTILPVPPGNTHIWLHCKDDDHSNVHFNGPDFILRFDGSDPGLPYRLADKVGTGFVKKIIGKDIRGIEELWIGGLPRGFEEKKRV